MNDNGYPNNRQPNPSQPQHPRNSQNPQYRQGEQQYIQHPRNLQYHQSPQYHQYPQNPQYYQAGRGGYSPQQGYYGPNQPCYPPVKKKSKITKIVILILLLAAMSAVVWYYARPIQQFTTKLYWQNQWRFVEGRAENEKEIKKMIEGFVSALDKKDANAAAAFIHPDKAEAYRKMFEANPDGMQVLAASLSEVKGIKMTDSKEIDKVSGRIAEVKIIYNETEYEIQLKKVNDKWYVFNI